MRSGPRLRILLAAVLFSTGGAAIKATTLDAWQVASFRSGIAALAVLAMLPGSRRGWSWRTGLVAVGYAATLTLFVQANKLTTAASTIFLQATAPVYMLAIGPLLLREPIRRRDVAFTAAIFCGMALLLLGNDAPRLTAPDPVRGNILAAFSGVCWALTVSGLRWMQRRDPVRGGGEAAVAAGNVLAFAVALPFALPVVSSRPADWAIIAFLGIFQIGVAYALLTRALGHVPAFDAALLLMAEPVLNPLWAWAIHGEAPSPGSNAGGALILGATLLKTWLDSRASPPARPPASS